MKSTLAVLAAACALLAGCESAPPATSSAPAPVPAPAAAPSSQPITIAPATAATAGTSAAPARGEPVPAMQVRTLRDAQQRLQQLGYEPGPADGANGPRTEQAMRAFQRDKGLRPTGRMDSPTREALGAAR